MKKLIVMIVAVFVVTELAAHHFYSKFPVTLKGYNGDKTNSVSYSGQIARHVLHDDFNPRSIKELYLKPLKEILNISPESISNFKPLNKIFKLYKK
jgi:hypothetical protein